MEDDEEATLLMDECDSDCGCEELEEGGDDGWETTAWPDRVGSASLATGSRGGLPPRQNNGHFFVEKRTQNQ